MSDLPLFMAWAITSFAVTISIFTYLDRSFYPKEKVSKLLLANIKQSVKVIACVVLTSIASVLVFASVYFSVDYLITK